MERSGTIMLIGIDRPEKRNAFTPKMFRELVPALTELDVGPAIRVELVHACGDHFTAGLDLPNVAEMRERGRAATGCRSGGPF